MTFSITVSFQFRFHPSFVKIENLLAKLRRGVLLCRVSRLDKALISDFTLLSINSPIPAYIKGEIFLNLFAKISDTRTTRDLTYVYLANYLHFVNPTCLQRVSFIITLLKQQK